MTVVELLQLINSNIEIVNDNLVAIAKLLLWILRSVTITAGILFFRIYTLRCQ